MDIKEHMKELSNAQGPSGYEDGIANLLEEAWRPLVDEIRRDALGNILALKKGKEGCEHKPIMLAAHMDEIGLMVSEIDDKGFIHFTTIGGFDKRVLPAQEVLIMGKKQVPGVIGAKPPHVQSAEERKKPVPWEELFIDCGLPVEKIKELVHVGDPITYMPNFTWLQDNVCAGKALDDRAGVAAITETLMNLQRRDHSLDIIAVATVQEEVTLAGAITSTYGIRPALGIAIDLGFAQRKGLEEDWTIKEGSGPALGWGPHVHPQMYEALKKTAQREEIPHQLEAVPFAQGTDAYGIQMSRNGVATALLSIPAAHMHTPLEVLDIRDIQRTGRLLAAFCSDIDADFVEAMSCL